VFILFQDKLFTVNFTHKFIDGLNVTGVVNRIVLHRDLFNQELWSLDSNFRFRFRASNFFCLRLQNNLVQKTGKHCIICITRLNWNPDFRLNHLKSFWLPPHSPGSNTSFIIATAFRHSLATVTQPEV